MGALWKITEEEWKKHPSNPEKARQEKIAPKAQPSGNQPHKSERVIGQMAKHKGRGYHVSKTESLKEKTRVAVKSVPGKIKSAFAGDESKVVGHVGGKPMTRAKLESFRRRTGGDEPIFDEDKPAGKKKSGWLATRSREIAQEIQRPNKQAGPVFRPVNPFGTFGGMPADPFPPNPWGQPDYETERRPIRRRKKRRAQEAPRRAPGRIPPPKMFGIPSHMKWMF